MFFLFNRTVQKVRNPNFPQDGRKLEILSCSFFTLMDPMPVREDTKYPINCDKSWHYHFNSLTNRTQTRSKVIYKDHTCHILIILSSLHQANLIKYEEKIRGFSFISWIHSCSAIYSHTDSSHADWHYFTFHIMRDENLWISLPIATMYSGGSRISPGWGRQLRGWAWKAFIWFFFLKTAWK